MYEGWGNNFFYLIINYKVFIMLSSKVESILFVSNGEINIKQIAKICSSTIEAVEVVLESLKEKYNQSESGVNIVIYENKVQMVTNPQNKELVSDLIKQEINSELTRPQLEALTIIAYRGPITKLELEQIRGVNCSLILRNLIIKGLINIKEDKIIDNNKYNITIEFMKHLGINQVDELPDYDKLSKAEKLEEVLNQDIN